MRASARGARSMRRTGSLRTVIARTFGAFPLWVWVSVGAVFGSTLGIGLYTFVYAGGLSYLSNDPNACVNCHVMREVYEGWNHSSHKSVATCNDCHIPHNFPAKYVAKGLNGWHHSVAFTTGKFKEPIRIKKYSREILQQNCLRCHGSFAEPVIHQDKTLPTDCLHCHSRVGHGW